MNSTNRIPLTDSTSNNFRYCVCFGEKLVYGLHTVWWNGKKTKRMIGWLVQ